MYLISPLNAKINAVCLCENIVRLVCVPSYQIHQYKVNSMFIIVHLHAHEVIHKLKTATGPYFHAQMLN